MGRKPSNVYDYFTRLDNEKGIHSGRLLRYECKKCKKRYATNATRLAEHIKLSGCFPDFESNQKATQTFNMNISSSIPNTTSRKNSNHTNNIPSSNQESIHSVHLSNYIHPQQTQIQSQTQTQTQLHHNLTKNETMVDNLGMLEETIHSNYNNNINNTNNTNTINNNNNNIIVRFSKISTCSIADALHQLGINGYLKNIKLLTGLKNPLDKNICGPAFTVQTMINNGIQKDKITYHYLDIIEPGSIIVIAAPEDYTTYHYAVFGGLMATAALYKEASGVVTNGRIRDVQEIAQLNFPSFSAGESVLGNSNMHSTVGTEVPITLGGCVVRTNDIIRGDINGVVVIPREKAADVALRAEVIQMQDNKIIEAIKDGEPVGRAIRRIRSRLEL